MVLQPRVGASRRLEFHVDCDNCFGLCCVALAFARSADFPFDKPAGDPCPHLDEIDACRIHDHLGPRGFRGCVTFDCFGAGQKLSQHTFAGRSWREDTATRASMFAAFPVLRRLHELLWYLDQALGLPVTDSLHAALVEADQRVRALAEEEPERLLLVDVDAVYDVARPLLIDASSAARAGRAGAGHHRVGPSEDLAGVDLRGADLCGAELRGSLLIGADLAGADLSWCDLLGADLRGANLAGARMGEALYLTQMQANSARGDASTVLPGDLERPAHWMRAGRPHSDG